MNLKGNNPRLIKELNRALIMRLVRENGPISRASLARKTGLSGPAVLNIVEGLVNEKFLFEIGKGVSNGGRKPNLLDINPESVFAIGLEITPNIIRAGIVNLDLEIVISRKKEIQPDSSYDFILDEATAIIKKIIKAARLKDPLILGIGVSHPGIMGTESGKVLLATNLKSWKDVPLVRDIERRLKMPAVIEVDSRVLALAEMWKGLAKNIKNFLIVEVETGLGTGLVIDSQIYRGSTGIAGELGHMVIDDKGEKCACGKKGCIETFVAFPAILKELQKKPSEKLLYFSKGNIKKITIENVIAAAKHGDPITLNVIKKSAEVLGKALGNLMNFIDIEAIFINSSLTSIDDYIEIIQEELNKYFLLSNGTKVNVMASKLKGDAAIIGSAILLLQEIFYAEKRNVLDRRKVEFA